LYFFLSLINSGVVRLVIPHLRVLFAGFNLIDAAGGGLFCTLYAVTKSEKECDSVGGAIKL
jgi:hypothetical protein